MQAPADMEHIMNASSRRPDKSIGYITNAFCHLVWPEEFRPQFTTALHLKRGNGPMKKAQPNPLSRHELHQAVTPIINRLVVLLCFLQPVPDFSQ